MLVKTKPAMRTGRPDRDRTDPGLRMTDNGSRNDPRLLVKGDVNTYPKIIHSFVDNADSL